jgi:3-oxo-5-alpha-steroid 4-dehydrogenase 1
VTERAVFDGLIVAWFVLAAVTFPLLFFVAAPYGRHARRGWGATIPSRWGWICMEAPAALVFAACFVLGGYRGGVTAVVFLVMWEVHYVHRAFIYPLQRRGGGKSMPLAVVGMGLAFNLVNGYLNGRYLFQFSGGYPLAWLWHPRFVAGAVLFVAGYVANRQADRTLRSLRKRGESGYEIPRGGLYRWISCPNYLGEIVEWIGWAIATWSPSGLAFAVWTIANLAPRARAHHRWYRQHFPDYPPERKALLPGIW